jgi:hypothetical protein
VVDVQTVSIAIASAGVFAAAIYYILQLRHQNRVRQTDLIMRLHTFSSSKEMIEAIHTFMNTEYGNYEEFVEKYGSVLSKEPVGIAFGMVGSFYEGIGILVHRKLADVNLISELFPAQAIWRKIEPLAKGMRKQYAEPSLLEWFEYLYSEIQKREQKDVARATLSATRRC